MASRVGIGERAVNVLRIQPSRQGQTVGWLELFFDLVYVATIIALGSWLSHHLSLEGVAGFALLFTTVWGSWVGTVLFMNRFAQNDVGQRLLVFLQMYFVVGLAAHLSEPLGRLSRGFALSFVLVIVVRILMYGRAWVTYLDARPLIKRYILGDAPLVLIWLVSAFVSPPLRYVLWVAGIVWGLSVPLLPQMRRWGEAMRPEPHHLSERVGLFTIIVLGEAFIKVVTSALGEEHHPFGLHGAFGMVVVVCLWWVYFDHANSATMREAAPARFSWFFAHLPLAIGITAVGVAIKNMVLTEPGHALMVETRWLLLSSLALCWLVLAFLELVTEISLPVSRRWLVIGRVLGAVVLMGVGLLGALDTAWMLSLAVLTCAVQVALDVYWRAKLALERSHRNEHGRHRARSNRV
jgi:low temperature requirement protein LtrA